MISLLRRLLVLAALFFWQGGFTFYAAVVVPIAQQQLGHRRQGFITQQVTHYLNVAGAACLVPLAWDAAASADSSRRRRRARWLAWLVMALALGVLAWLHAQMDNMLEPAKFGVLDEPTFQRVHRAYLWASTLQWACALVYAGLALVAWRDEDSRPAVP
jgi:hypothetical protein